MSSESWLLRGGHVVDPSQDLDGPFDLWIDNGEVSALLPAGSEPPRQEKAPTVVDAHGLVVAPGFIDIHVHLREPGQEYKETVRTGMMAAANGGFTAVAAMANTEPVNDNRSVTEHILAEARRFGYARVHPIGAVSKRLAGEELAGCSNQNCHRSHRSGANCASASNCENLQPGESGGETSLG